jgi:hypothetical protein
MSSITRQNSLFSAENWTRVYQTFRDADFESYDFETLRKTMIDYLKLYYPEDFNDFLDSSEYIALIDLIAFLGQSLAFRGDLNARENFLDTAERRDSILKLVRLISYSPKRCIPAAGLLKFDSISTTEILTDSNGVNLSNLVVSWNDSTNSNWYEQFTQILNATFVNSQVIGNPGNTQTINGILNQEYSVNIQSGVIPRYPFSATVSNNNMVFEAVGASSINESYLYEIEPKPVSKFNILYRNDNQGNGSNNTGFFLYFKQGTLQATDFSITDAIPNRVLTIGYNNINNTDIWLYDLDTNNNENNLWDAVPAISGLNVVYNQSTNRNLYQVNTLMNDQISLVFGDGSFANIPQGNYRLYFRVSSGLTYKITPDEIQGIAISINYISRTNNVETLTITASLNYTVANATSSESSDDIRQKAPQQYYTQGRMITGEDYNIVPYTSFSDIIKVKALNRTSSGISRYLDISDSSGMYSSTNIFADDGFLYEENYISSAIFSVTPSLNTQQIVNDTLNTILNSKELKHFCYANFTRYQTAGSLSDPNLSWNLSSVATNGSTGYFYYPVTENNVTTNKISQLGTFTSSTAQNIVPGSIVHFKAPTGNYFNAQFQIVPLPPGTQTVLPTGGLFDLYVSISQVTGDGTNGQAGNFRNGTGPVMLSQKVPTGAQVYEIFPVQQTSLPLTISLQINDKVSKFNDFALKYDLNQHTWFILEKINFSINDAFSMDPSKLINTTQIPTPSGHDPSWLIAFQYSASIGYTVSWRSLNYVFESGGQTNFYFDNNVKVYDSSTATTIHDHINILKINTNLDGSTQVSLGVDYPWYIYSNVIEVDGYQNQNKVLLTFTDDNANGIPDNPDIFRNIIPPSAGSLVFFNQVSSYDSFLSFVPIDTSLVETSYSSIGLIPVTGYLPGQVFYVSGKFYVLTATSSGNVLVQSSSYIAKPGRNNLYFQYRHNSPGYRRIDPSPSNIMDLYILTESYANDYASWIQDTTNTIPEPTAPSPDDLMMSYSTLENLKAQSDTVVYNSAVFKPLFGSKADITLQATFKIVKNASINISDNDVKSNVVNAINNYFQISNWDFGETFYFSELSAYLHTALSPNVSSIIIVPKDPGAMFGSLYQINAEANEIVTSAATVNDVEIISAITAASINSAIALSL